MQLVQIPTDNVAQAWCLVDEFIAKACERGEYEKDELQRQCLLGSATLWMIWSGICEAALVTTTIQKDKTLLIAACGGKGVDGWISLLSELEAWAKKEGKTGIRIYGRRGWARKLPDYRINRIILDKRF